MKVENASVLQHKHVAGDYHLLVFQVDQMGSLVRPGQFVHLRVPRLENAVLRRPFSIYRADATSLSVLYKRVGIGTRAMADIKPGEPVNLIGPLGHGFPRAQQDQSVALVAGGYGVAPLSLLAGSLPMTGDVFIGGRSVVDILCVEDFEKLGWKVHITTEDGSLGEKGMVTAPLDRWLSDRPSAGSAVLYACGPDGLLKAVGDRAVKTGQTAWLSLDKHMGCGVGACLACVQRIRQEDGSVVWKRVCKDGPVFEAREIVWERHV